MKLFLSASGLLLICTCIYGQQQFTDARDGNIYRTITVSGETWMAENLRYKLKPGALYFENDSNNYLIYGVLYDWKTAQKACPENWHLPSGGEFRELANHFENRKSWSKTESEPSSFNIQLGGMQDYEGTFSEMNESGYYWTSTEYDRGNAEYFSYLLIDEMQVIDISRKADFPDIHGSEKSNKYSVRCVKY